MRYEFSIDECFSHLINEKLAHRQRASPRGTPTEYGRVEVAPCAEHNDEFENIESSEDIFTQEMILAKLVAAGCLLSLLLSMLLVYDYAPDADLLLIPMSVITLLLGLLGLRELILEPCIGNMMELLVMLPHPNIVTY